MLFTPAPGNPSWVHHILKPHLKNIARRDLQSLRAIEMRPRLLTPQVQCNQVHCNPRLLPEERRIHV
jgi:hypothetical protein